MSAPRTAPTNRATTHEYELPCKPANVTSRPKNAIIPSVWTSAIVYPRKPSSEPTDRSMLRDTMIRTMPVAMIAIDVLWTERFQRFRDVRKRPPDRMLNVIQMAARDTTIPSRRVSSSVAIRNERHRRSRGGCAATDELGLVPRTVGASVSVNVHSRGAGQQTATEPAVTPLHTFSLLVQPASMTTSRLSLVMGCGWSR